MTSFQKMILVPHKEMSKINATDQNLKDEVLKIKQPKMNKREKRAVFKHALSKYIENSKKEREPLQMDIVYKPLKKDQPFVDDNVDAQRIRESMPKTLWQRGWNMFKKLKLNPNVKLADSYTYFWGKKFPNHLIDYVAESMQPRTKNTPLRGYNNFVKLLKEEKTKVTSLQHTLYQKRLQALRKYKNDDIEEEEDQSGGGFLRRWITYKF